MARGKSARKQQSNMNQASSSDRTTQANRGNESSQAQGGDH